MGALKGWEPRTEKRGRPLGPHHPFKPLGKQERKRGVGHLGVMGGANHPSETKKKMREEIRA